MNQFEILRNFCQGGKKFHTVEEIHGVSPTVLRWIKARVSSGELIMKWLMNTLPRSMVYDAIKASDEEEFKKLDILWRLHLVNLAELHFSSETK